MAEYHSNGTLLRRFIHGLGNDDPVIRYEGSGVNARRYLLADERGSIIAEMTANGGLLQAHQYDAYGNPKNSSDARFRFTGQILIPGTELYYYKARVYHPRLGRFMQTDPIGYKDGMNWYAYVGNDPLNATDPSGSFRRPLFRLLKNPWWSAKRGYRDFKRFLSDNGVIAPTPTPATNSDLNDSDVPEPWSSGPEQGALPKPPRGAGSVPKDQRDPKRFFSPDEREAKRDQQGGKCANGCDTDIDSSNSAGHHIDRHADGGQTIPENHAEVCTECHKDLHSKDK
ncbi:tRNA3(Ser)-specific nuclease WapA [Pseudidiomarina piscicola]|uniref:tRNA3(Ser)-specific nuclease WapA n=1 Tax=Pseudidiomarina piscicola TaxID=2614830 RepID=A0A6S6WP37_9GAMM|nr:tRNA3(Ser)-specific nuclease WapA [Pseudidiomarina piscicola]VZT41345.1 tRNA3(Ser)-specific nuclease WapA [Pseudomonas aeruginosa]